MIYSVEYHGLCSFYMFICRVFSTLDLLKDKLRVHIEIGFNFVKWCAVGESKGLIYKRNVLAFRVTNTKNKLVYFGREVD